MQREFGGAAFEPLNETRRDREITLGPAGLAALALGLFALCAGCFLGGYAVGHRNASPATQAAAAEPSAAQLLSATQAKPTPAPGSSPAHNADAAPDGAEADSAAADAGSASGSAAPGSAEVVQTALPAQPNAAQPGAGQTGSAQAAGSVRPVQPALAQGPVWMVQIAAVSQQEDADVLVNALRKRGYAVTAKHDPADELIHVQVGPFASHDAAAAERQKLVNDGYNAIIQP